MVKVIQVFLQCIALKSQCTQLTIVRAVTVSGQFRGACVNYTTAVWGVHPQKTLEAMEGF